MSAAAEDPITPPSEVTDADLLGDVGFYLDQRLSGNGEAPDDAWQRFYDIYQPLIRCFARRCGVPTDEHDDCVQETLRTVIIAFRDFKYDTQRGRFRGWLFSVVRSRATDLMRRRMRCRTSQDHAGRSNEQPDTSIDVAEEIDRRWRSAVTNTVVERLRESVAPRSFEVFRLRSIEGLSVREVAEKMNTTPEKVRYRHHRTLRKFRDLYLLLTGEHY